MNKKALFEKLCSVQTLENKILFRPILMHFAARLNNKTYAEFASDYKVLVECNLRAMEVFDTDMVGLISDPYRETSAFGAKISFPPENVPVCENMIVNSLDDVKALKIPNIYKNERTLDRINGAKLFQKELNGSVPVIGWVEGPLAEACDLAGIDNVLTKMFMEPDFVKLLLDKCLATAKDFAKAQIEEGCDVIGIGDAICSQIDEHTYAEFILPLHTDLVKFIQSVGAKVKLHICGNISHLLPHIAKFKPDILDIDWQVDRNKVYEVMGKDIIRCGNINPVEIQDRTTDELKSMVEAIVKEERNRKFILSGGCEITVNTPHQNLKVLREYSILT